ncbi:hypothetical protein RHMOL_Rhmol09G0002500 [Rhododendron molle]|uniref:Uncharacterized protein n=1 Tax=Rhododendron molle TaxID=49168 RepID=A0ACC0M861_RHOML|nr:hypothetical protein RHMOL_Rhmol09G0002500 [Rhododendron molle]
MMRQSSSDVPTTTASTLAPRKMLKSRHFIDGFAWTAGGNEEEMLRVVLMQPILVRIICFPSLGAYKENPAYGSWRSQFLSETKKSFRAFECLVKAVVMEKPLAAPQGMDPEDFGHTFGGGIVCAGPVTDPTVVEPARSAVQQYNVQQGGQSSNVN